MFKYYVIKIDDNKNHFLFELKLEAGYFANMNYAINPEGNINVIGLAYDKEEDVRSWYFTTIDLESNSFSVENNSYSSLIFSISFFIKSNATGAIIFSGSFVGKKPVLKKNFFKWERLCDFILQGTFREIFL